MYSIFANYLYDTHQFEIGLMSLFPEIDQFNLRAQPMI